MINIDAKKKQKEVKTMISNIKGSFWTSSNKSLQVIGPPTLITQSKFFLKYIKI